MKTLIVVMFLLIAFQTQAQHIKQTDILVMGSDTIAEFKPNLGGFGSKQFPSYIYMTQVDNTAGHSDSTYIYKLTQRASNSIIDTSRIGAIRIVDKTDVTVIVNGAYGTAVTYLLNLIEGDRILVVWKNLAYSAGRQLILTFEGVGSK